MTTAKVRVTFTDGTEKICWLVELSPTGLSIQEHKEFSPFNAPRFYSLHEVARIDFFEKRGQRNEP